MIAYNLSQQARMVFALPAVSASPDSFTRLFTLLRGVVWDRFELGALLAFYGTAGGRRRMRAQAEQGYLPSFAPVSVG